MPIAQLVARALLRVATVTCLASIAATARAQDTTATANLRPTPDSLLVVLTLRDGSTLLGRVREVTPTTVRFASAAGELTIPREAIRGVRTTPASVLHNGEAWPEDPGRTRLFFTPTGRTLRQGEGYFADAYVFFPSVQLGVTDRITVGGGLSIVPGLGLDEQLYYLTPKVGVYGSPNVNVSVGALVAGARYIDSPVGMGYGVATFGGEDANVSAGAGFGFSRGSTSHAVLMLGGERRVSRSIALLTENYLYTGSGAGGLFSGGIRFMGEKLSADLAGFTTRDSSVPVVPYVAFMYHF